MKVRLFGMHCLIALLGALGVSQLVDGKYVEETFYPTRESAIVQKIRTRG